MLHTDEIVVDYEYKKNVFSELAAEYARKTWKNREERPSANTPANSDGVGTKTDVADRMYKFDTIGWDLIAMLADDAVRTGATPKYVTNVLDMRKCSEEVVRQLFEGISQAAVYAGVEIINGETEESGNQIRGYSRNAFIWSGTVINGQERKAIDEKKIRAGASIIALHEKGLRSNGFTLARKILEKKYGTEWHNARFEDKLWGDILLKPSTIYTPAILDILESYSLKGIAHITGGGIPEKLGRLLEPTGLSAVVDKPFSPPEPVKELQKLGEVPDEKAYKEWNMGQGMLLVCNKRNTEGIINIVKEHNVESKVVGEVTRTKDVPTIRITSQGYFSNGRTIAYKMAV